jgi:hypothetical protein
LKSAAIAFKPEEFESHMNILRAHEKGREIDCWINDAQPELWIRSKFPISRFGITNSNSVEVVFSALRPARFLPVLYCLLELETYSYSKKFEKHLKSITYNDCDLVEAIQNSLEIEIEQSVFYRVRRTGINTAVISGTSVLRNYSVDIKNSVCSCGKFQEMQFPCTHACVFLLSIGKDPKQFCHRTHYGYFHKMLYDEDVDYRPTVLADLLAAPILAIEPPTQYPKRGRPKSDNRIESQSRTPSTRKARVVICPLCKFLGHYAKKCPLRNLPPPTSPNQ